MRSYPQEGFSRANFKTSWATASSANSYDVTVSVLESTGAQVSASLTCSVVPAAPVDLTSNAVSSCEIDRTWTNQASTYDIIEIDRSTFPVGPLHRRDHAFRRRHELRIRA